MYTRRLGILALATVVPVAALANGICTGFGPQSPRDIAQKSGENTKVFNFAPQPWAMNLCNIHTHTHAEHRGPGFMLPAGADLTIRQEGGHAPAPAADRQDPDAGHDPTSLLLKIAAEAPASEHDGSEPGHDAEPPIGDHNAHSQDHGTAAGSNEPAGGWRCNETATLSTSERADPWGGMGPYGNVRPGDTIEVHWVYTTCDVTPGPTLGSCLSETCANPQLRVESQVFLLVNDHEAPSFSAYTYAGNREAGRPQPKSLPSGTGEPVVFHGSTTGPSYTEETCSPYQVTWSVRPYCMKLNVMSLHAWSAAANVFAEDHSHGVRELVTAPELLAPID